MGRAAQGGDSASPLPELTRHELGSSGAPEVAALIPRVPGVIQLVGSNDESIVVAQPANLNRWASERLGLAKARARRRPHVNLSGVTTAIRFATTTSAFQQRLLFERVMARSVPDRERRDLRTPGYLQLDTTARFPRLAVRDEPGDGAAVYGPWPSRSAAQQARDRLHRLFALRPCDYDFEPAPELPLGLGCLYAQVETCAAPCLTRMSERDYGRLAESATTFLGRPSARSEESGAWIPPWVTGVGAGHAVVAEPGSLGLELYPVRRGTVWELGAASTRGDPLVAAAALNWPDEAPVGRDLAWLSAWLVGTRRRGVLVVLEGDPSPHEIGAAVRSALDRPMVT